MTYRLCGTAVTWLVAWLWTGSMHVAVGISLVDMALKTGVFYLHERFWNRVAFGKKKTPEYQI